MLFAGTLAWMFVVWRGALRSIPEDRTWWKVMRHYIRNEDALMPPAGGRVDLSCRAFYHPHSVAFHFPGKFPAPDARGGMTVMLPVKITINGRAVERDIEPRLLLVHFIRDVAGLTGTKVGCDTSQCGACTVLVDGVAMKSCTRLGVQADGATITTIEGLATNGRLHQVQESFWGQHGLQCGFCTPGMILASVALLRDNPKPTAEQVRHGIEGNLCRCTGYQNIVRAVCDAAAAGGGRS